MKIINPSIILNPTIKNNEKTIEILKNYGILYDKKIIKIAPIDIFKKTHPSIKIWHFDGLLTPTLANTHTHLEFSANKTSFRYGSFGKWLCDINAKKYDFNPQKQQAAIENALECLKYCGVGAVGEISSFGLDLMPISKSPLKFSIFHEILGLKNYEKISENFKAKWENAHNICPQKSHQISIHSTYSLSDKLYDFAFDFAKKNNLDISFHYLESRDEIDFLKGKNNALKKHLKTFCNDFSVPNRNFLKDFSDFHTIFIHCVFLKDWEMFCQPKNDFYIAHCPFSNRLLSNGVFNFKKALKNNAKITLATDGLSSNISLNMFDEARACLLTHQNIDYNTLLKEIFFMMTFTPHLALRTGSNTIQEGFCADFSLFKINTLNYHNLNADDVLSEFILQTKNACSMVLDGKKIF